MKGRKRGRERKRERRGDGFDGGRVGRARVIAVMINFFTHLHVCIVIGAIKIGSIREIMIVS